MSSQIVQPRPMAVLQSNLFINKLVFTMLMLHTENCTPERDDTALLEQRQIKPSNLCSSTLLF